MRLLFGVSKMSLETQIKKLRGNIIFERCYNKHKKRRNRDKSISLEKCRLNAIKEYVELLQKYETEAPNIEEIEKERDYYIMIGGVSMLNSKWKELIQTQKELGDTKINPSPRWEDRSIRYLKSLFHNSDEETSDEKRTVDIW